jgi:hypothetical protein
MGLSRLSYIAPSSVPFGAASEFGLEKSHLLWRRASESAGQMSLPVTYYKAMSYSQLDRQRFTVCQERLLRSDHRYRRHDPKGLPLLFAHNSVPPWK